VLIWGSALLFGALGLGFLGLRKDFARYQAMIFGGSIAPGCVALEAAVLFLIALAIALLHVRGLV
jgi:hypothetical protein